MFELAVGKVVPDEMIEIFQFLVYGLKEVG